MALLLKNLLFTFIVPGTVAVYVPLQIAEGHAIPSPWAVAAALPFFAVGGAIYAWCVWDFATFGRGTPAPIDAPRKLVVRGLYHYLRNPMYVGVLTVLLGHAMLFRSGSILLYGAFVGAAFHLFVLLYEEPHLRQAFGDEYRSYCSEVGRWLPKLDRHPG
jgi:protein-S-isoprenylcysteine O-methyltransferase Ste14